MKTSLCMLLIVALSFYVHANIVSANCDTWNGYNLTALSYSDIIGSDNSLSLSGHLVIIRLCGIVSRAPCLSTSANASVCVYGNNLAMTGPNQRCVPAFVYAELPDFQTPVWNYINTNNVSVGITVTVLSQTQTCLDGAAAVTIVNFWCQPTAQSIPTSLMADATINSTSCTITLNVATALACPNTPALSAPLPPSITPTSPCYAGQFAINLLPAFQQDLFYSTSTGFSFQMNICAPVTMASNINSSLWMYPTCNGNNGYSVINYNPAEYVWSFVNGANTSNGIGFIVNNGELCSSSGAWVNRTAIIQLQCLPTATTPYIDSVIESPQCVHNIVVFTNITCSMTVAEITGNADNSSQCLSGCCGLGYDFSSLSRSDMWAWQLTGTYRPWAMRMCGSVVTTKACPGAMVCLEPSSATGTGYAAAYFRQASSPLVWSYNNKYDWTGGLHFISNSGSSSLQSGSGCTSGFNRTVKVVFLCNTVQSYLPSISSIVEFPPCFYTFTVMTSVVCNAPSYAGGGNAVGPALITTALPVSIVTPVIPSQLDGCVWQGYDFSPLSTYDMYFADGVNIYLYVQRVCGTLSDTFCTAVTGLQSGSSCQIRSRSPWNAHSHSSWLLSSWNPYMPLYTYPSGDYTGGVKLQIQNGWQCINGPRATRWWFVCDPNADIAYIVNVIEPAGQDYNCHYEVEIATKIVCQAPPNPNMTASVVGGE